MNKSKKSFLEVAVVIGFAIALCIIAIIVISIVGGKSGKNKNIPLLCAEPAYPETIQAKDGEYVRKLSTYWWVVDVKNGKVILHDQNKIKEGFNIDKSCGVADFRGRITVPCEFTEEISRISASSTWAATASKPSTAATVNSLRKLRTSTVK